MSAYVDHQMTNHHGFGLLSSLGETVRTWRRRYQTRHELAGWSDRDLHDVGLSRCDIALEADKPFWRA